METLCATYQAELLTDIEKATLQHSFFTTPSGRVVAFIFLGLDSPNHWEIRHVGLNGSVFSTLCETSDDVEMALDSM